MATKVIAELFFQPIKDVLNRIVLEVLSLNIWCSSQTQLQRYSLDDDDTVGLMSPYEAATAICTVFDTAFIHIPFGKGL